MKRVRLIAAIACCAVLQSSLSAEDAARQVLFHIKVLEVTPQRLTATTGAEDLAGYLNLEPSRDTSVPGIVGVSTDSKTVSLKLEELCRNKVAKMLAAPSIVTMSGRPVSFRSGGEVPIVVPGGVATKTVEFRSIGTKLDILPTLADDGKLRVEMRFEQNEINGTDDNGIPKFRSRQMDLGLEMRAGQTVALLQNTASTDDETKQLVLFVTPECVKPLPAPRVEYPQPVAIPVRVPVPRLTLPQPPRVEFPQPVAIPVRVPAPRLTLPQPSVCLPTAPAVVAEHRIRKLTEAAASLREIGMHDEARKLADQANEARRELQRCATPPLHPLNEVRHDVRQLHNEVHQLRSEIKRLAELLQRQVGDAPATAQRLRPAAHHAAETDWFQQGWRPVESEWLSSPPSALPKTSHGFHRERSAAEKIEGRLKKKVMFNFKSITLEDAVNRLAAAADVNVYLHKRGLQAEGVSLDTQVWGRFGAKPVAIQDILVRMLDAENLTFVIENEVLKITSKFQAYPLSARAYAVGTLVVDPKGRVDFDPLIKKITDEIAPDFWEKEGGPAAIAAFPSNLSLVVYQTDRAHEQINQLINNLTVEARKKDNAKTLAPKQSAGINVFPKPNAY